MDAAWVAAGDRPTRTAGRSRPRPRPGTARRDPL